MALAGDGDTALVGGDSDSDLTGALWVFMRDGSGHWSQLGSKLVAAARLAGMAVKAVRSRYQQMEIRLKREGPLIITKSVQRESLCDPALYRLPVHHRRRLPFA